MHDVHLPYAALATTVCPRSVLGLSFSRVCESHCSERSFDLTWYDMTLFSVSFSRVPLGPQHVVHGHTQEVSFLIPPNDFGPGHWQRKVQYVLFMSCLYLVIGYFKVFQGHVFKGKPVKRVKLKHVAAFAIKLFMRKLTLIRMLPLTIQTSHDLGVLLHDLVAKGVHLHNIIVS